MTASVCVSLSRFGSDRRGHVAITFGLMGAILMMSIGVASDIGRAFQTHQRLQNALDVAALAAMKAPPDARAEVAAAYFRENVAGALGMVADPVIHALGDGSFKISAHVSVPTTITRLMRVDAIEMDAVAIAAPSGAASAASMQAGSPGGVPCLHALDEAAAEAWRLAGASGFDASACEVYVRSGHGEAAALADNRDVSLRNIRAVGGVAQAGDAVAIAALPYVTEPHAPVVGDPYLAAVESILGVLKSEPCTTANTHQTVAGGQAQPGTYCGYTTFEDVTFSPGVYMIASGARAGEDGRLDIKGRVDGSGGVTFYLADRATRIGAITTEADSVLEAPSTGVTRGLLFVENAVGKSGWSLTLDGLAPQSWGGAVYLPTAMISFSRLRDWTRLELGLVARTIALTDVSGRLTPFAWTPYNASDPITYAPALYSQNFARLSR